MNQMTRYFSLISVSLFIYLLLVGCKKEEDNPIFNIDIKDEFYVDLWEELLPGQRLLSIAVQTIEPKACQNAVLDYSYKERGATHVFSINDIVEPDDCIADSTLIEATIPTETAFEDGSHFIEVNLKEEIINRGKLRVTPEYYEVTLNSDFGIQLLHSKLYRVTPNSVWGYVGYADAADAALAQAAIDDLVQLAQPGTFTAGYYGYFELDESQHIQLNQPINQPLYIPLLLQFEADKSALIDMLNEYRSNYPNQLEFVVQTAEGEHL